MPRKLLFIVAVIRAGVVMAAELPYPVLFVHGWNSDNTTWDGFLNGTLRPALGNPSVPVFQVLTNSNLTSTNWQDDIIVESPHDINGHIQVAPLYTINFWNWRTNTLPYSLVQNTNPPEGSAGNESAIVKNGKALGMVVDSILAATGKDKVILVAHSAGGLVSREYLQREDSQGNHPWWVEPTSTGGHHIAKLVTIGTPHLGSNLAGGICDAPGLVEVSPPDSPIATLSPFSELVRDMRYCYRVGSTEEGFWTVRGLYLFGGNEADIVSTSYHNIDVDCNGQSTDAIVGISDWNSESQNTNMPLPSGVEYLWYTSNGPLNCLPPGGNGDGVVDLQRQYLHTIGDTMLTNECHGDEPEDADALIRSLDCMNTSATPWKIDLNTQIIGWFTYQPFMQALDYDNYSFVLSEPNNIIVHLISGGVANKHLRVIREDAVLYDEDIAGNVSVDLGFQTGGTLTISAWADADNDSWQLPYVLRVEASDITPPFPVSDLALFRNELNGYVSWTATGDDGVEGRAIHTLRMSTEPLTEFNFDNATLLYQDEHLGGGINGAFFTFPFTDETYYIAMQVCDEAGNCSGLSNILTEYIPPGEIPQGNYISAAEYFIDTDPGPGNGVSLPITAGQSPFGNWTIPVSSLGHGVHHLYLRMRDDDGRWFSPMRRSFVVTAPQLTTVPTNVRAEISFDQEPNGTNDVDLIVAPDWEVVANLESSPSALDLGPHDLYLRFVYNDTLISAPQRRSFRVTPPLPEGGQRIVAAEYFTDNDPGEGLGWLLEPDEGEDVTIAANFPADTMPPGMHELSLRVRSADGIWSSPARRSFHVGRSGSILADAEYFWDVDPGHGLGQTIDYIDAFDVVLTPEVSVPELAPGVHSFSVRFRSLLGEWSGTARRWIHIRPAVPVGGYAISNAEAFIDTDPGIGQGIVVPASDGTLDEADEVLLRYASPIGLGVGNHTAYMRIQDNTGRWSTLARDSFAVVPPIEVSLTAIADSLGDSLRLRWNAFPEALTYAIHWDTLTNGSFDNVIPVQPPDTLLVWPLDQSPKRFFYVTALLPDTTLVRQSFLQKAPANRRLP